jgi:hypothetical protein
MEIEKWVSVYFLKYVFSAFSACAEEHEADSEPTVAKLYGEELHKIKMFEALDIKTQKTNLQVVQATEKQHLNSYMGSNILAASLCVGDESEEEAGAGAVIPMMDAENAGVACPKLLVGKQSNWIKNYCENDGTTAASSNVLPKPSHMKPSPVSIQQKNHVVQLIIEFRC